MGRRRKRLIVQADLTSEDDREFIAWVLERRRKRRLAQEIREALHRQYQERTGRTAAPLSEPERAPILDQVSVHEPGLAPRESGSPATRLQRLVDSF